MDNITGGARKSDHSPVGCRFEPCLCKSVNFENYLTEGNMNIMTLFIFVTEKP